MLSKKFNYLMVFALFVGLTSIAMTDHPVVDQSEDEVAALNIKGTVTDAETGEPIPDVEVEIQELAMTETTDEDGNFEIRDIQQGGIYTIVINHEGYEEYQETHEVTDQNTQTQTETDRQQDQQFNTEDENRIEIELEPTN